MKDDNFIKIRGAEVNNLKKIDLDIPRDKFVVITGVSGSGKSSLAFDTIFAEGQRRFSESLSSFARQFLGRMTKPAVKSISGIPPAIAVEQKVNTKNPRSTVGTTTEIYDYIRMLFAKIGHTFSPISGNEVTRDSLQSVLSFCGKLPDKSTAYILSNMAWSEKKYRVEKLLNYKEEGFTRLYIIGQTGRDAVIKIDKVLENPNDFKDKDLMLLIDRVYIDTEDTDLEARLTDSIRTAFEKGNEHMSIISDVDNSRSDFSTLFEADGIVFDKPEEWIFNFNNPLGACDKCEGYGKIMGIDESLVIPFPHLSIYEDTISCWKGKIMSYFKDNLIMFAEKYNISIHKPYRELSDLEKKIIWEGNKDIIGINKFFAELEKKKYKIQNRYMISRYSGKTKCPKCHGTRLRPESLYIKIGGKNIAELLNMSISDLNDFFTNLRLDDYEKKIAGRALEEIHSRLGYLINVGLSYLTLSRASNTLSGGESQRVNLVTSLGNSLTGAMYILDEPSIGLHERDTQKLIHVLKDLRDLGNTVIVVEHDEEIMRAADYLIDIGPGAGINGGQVMFQGKLGVDDKNSSTIKKSLTLQYLHGLKSIQFPKRKHIAKSYIEITGACENNLKNIDVKFPLKAMTAVIGVSGSGKSTLVGDIMYPALQRHINQFGTKPGEFDELKGDLNSVTSIEYVDQNPIGKSSRSNPVTYLKIYDDIRKLFSEQPYAKMNGYGHSHFSFNIDGGRCPECQGAGTITIPMQFMADITIVCDQCGGKRFKPDILEVKYQGKNISDILDMSVDEAYDFFNNQKNDNAAQRIAKKLIPLKYVGLNYIKLGQSSSTLSGGESQRVKLAYFLSKDNSSKSGESILFVFDEPTTGLHFEDIQKLIQSFEALINRGHTIIVVEHNPFIIKASDYTIELGPEGGDRGGYLIRAAEI